MTILKSTQHMERVPSRTDPLAHIPYLWHFVKTPTWNTIKEQKNVHLSASN